VMKRVELLGAAIKSYQTHKFPRNDVPFNEKLIEM